MSSKTSGAVVKNYNDWSSPAFLAGIADSFLEGRPPGVSICSFYDYENMNFVYKLLHSAYEGGKLFSYHLGLEKGHLLSVELGERCDRAVGDRYCTASIIDSNIRGIYSSLQLVLDEPENFGLPPERVLQKPDFGPVFHSKKLP